MRYFINEVDIGMGPEVVKKVMSSDRPFGPSVAYYMAILSTFMTFKPLHAHIKTTTWSWEGKIRTSPSPMAIIMVTEFVSRPMQNLTTVDSAHLSVPVFLFLISSGTRKNLRKENMFASRRSRTMRQMRSNLLHHKRVRLKQMVRFSDTFPPELKCCHNT